MKRVQYSSRRRERLDSNLEAIAGIKSYVHNSQRSVIREVREALGMTRMDLGRRLKVSHSRIGDLERKEADASLQLKWLLKAADAMNCRVAYVFVPKAGSFAQTVSEQADRKMVELEVIREEALQLQSFWQESKDARG